jgi:NAD-dependent deacetylase
MKHKKHIVILTGAGVSAESGIRTFRDGDGLWEQHNIEDVASPEAWRRNPELVLRFYNERRKQILNTTYNKAHELMAKLESHYKVSIVTQNIDDLHERAGSSTVLHLHGEILKMRSSRNENLVYPIYKDIHIQDTAADGAPLRPHIVWFGEAVPLIEEAITLMEKADVFLLVGSSLHVYPAASLIDYVPNHCPKYVVDTKIPPIGHHHIIPIQATATVGMELFYKNMME